jgi:YidC/Oxa1 family membrane protein insertase
MNQTRTFLLIAWLVVAFLLFQQWQTPTVPQATQAAVTSTPSPGVQPVAQAATATGLPALPQQAGNLISAPPQAAQSAASTPIEIVTDVLRLRVDLKGVSIISSELLSYPKEKVPGSANVVLLNDQPATLFIAESGWLTANRQAEPNHNAVFETLDGKREYRLADGQNSLSVPFIWRDASGVVLTKTLQLTRGSFSIGLEQELLNTGTAPWTGFAYEQLKRLPPPPPPTHAGFTNPEAFSFVGAAWYGEADKFEKIKFDEFLDEGVLQSPNKALKGGWFGMLEHHFVSIWVPGKGETQTVSIATEGNPAQALHIVRGMAPQSVVAPGASLKRKAALWVGPKAQKAMTAVHPSLDLSVDYGIFSFLSKPLFWLLSLLHNMLGNWGWAIIAIVIILKALLFPLSAKQYESAAKMRAVQPRLEALKERYGDDRQKMATAQMELFKKEKINPVSGCLPTLIPIPIFLALYWVLIESVELRQAPWIGWIQNLTAPDPYFILPVINLVVMFLTQKLTPMPNMDPLQKKMLTFMPLIFGVMMAFFPSGLVLYWVVNGMLGLAQQWYMTKKYHPKTAHA